MAGAAPLSVLPAVTSATTTLHSFATALHVSAAALHASSAAVHSSTARGSRASHASCLCEFWCDCHERDCHRERNSFFHVCIPCTVLPSDLEMKFER
jgi:hypothetical protein